MWYDGDGKSILLDHETDQQDIPENYEATIPTLGCLPPDHPIPIIPLKNLRS